MKKTFVLMLGLLLVLSVAASADINNWQIKCGVTGNTYPYGNDYGTRFGINSIGTYAFDGQDSVHPAPGDPFSDLQFVYKPYQSAYTTATGGDTGGWTWATGGYLTKGSYVSTTHGPGLPTVGWPTTGVMKDTRAPMVAGVPEFWKVTVAAPMTDDADGIHFEWSVGQESGLEIPSGDSGVIVKVLANADLAAAGISGDLVLWDPLHPAAGTFDTASFPQFGVNVDGDGNPISAITHTWIIEAKTVPEPGTIMLMAGGLLGLGGLIRRRK